MASQPAASTEPAVDRAPIVLMFIGDRRGGRGQRALYERLAELARRYFPLVTLRATSPSRVPGRYAERAKLAPAVLVLRRGVVVGEATGATLPTRELNSVVRRAVQGA